MRKLIILLPLVLCSVFLVSCGSDRLNEKKATEVLRDYLEKSADKKFQKTEPFLVQGENTVRTKVHYSYEPAAGVMMPGTTDAIFQRSQSGTWYLTSMFSGSLNIEVK